MDHNALRSYIAKLPVDEDALTVGIEEEAPAGAVQPSDIPNGIVTGSNLIEFDGEVDIELRSAVALSLLAAQRVASTDSVVATPDQWLERHDTVLHNLNWIRVGGGTVEETFDTVGVEVHRAIIPFLAAAFGGVAAASSLILTALEQLQSMDEDAPWITLFDRESRRFSVTEYHFTRVAADADQVLMNFAAARFSVSYGRTQVLFFKVTHQQSKFQLASAQRSAEATLVRLTREALETRLSRLTNQYIRELEL